MSIKAIIVEDSRLARLELNALLADYQDINVVAEAENAEQAQALIAELKPDALFLDINLPGQDGFELLASLDDVPLVIFTTAYDQYAIKSFEFNALDYLLKPIASNRLEQAIEKLRQQHRQLAEEKSTENDEQLHATSQFFVKDGEQCWMVKLAEVSLMEAIGNYTRLYFGDNKPMIYKPLTKIQARLAPGLFFRANRQQLVNIQYVNKVESSISGGLVLALKTGQSVQVSRRQSVEFKQLFSL